MNLTKPRPGIELNRRVKVVKVNGDRVTVIEIDGVKYSFLKEIKNAGNVNYHHRQR